MTMIGRRIDNGRYEIVEEVGTGSTAGRGQRGGFAIVYLGRDTRLHDTPVAIKYLRSDVAENESVCQSFKYEVQLSARLRHRNIVQVKDQIQEGDDHFVIFEYVDGANMKYLLAAARERRDVRYSAQYGGRLPTELSVHIVREVCNALEYAHNLEDSDQGLPLNIVHRDISPQNVLVSFDGEVKLTDFGIAKARDCGEHTQTGLIKGKYHYMSPEQITGQPLDRTSDLYSLGIVLYEALAGERLFSGETDYELQRRVARGGIDKEKLEDPAVAPGLRRILAKALQPDRSRRYQSGAQMAADLAEFIAGKYSLDRALGDYMHSAFPHVISQSESTATVDAVPARGSSGKGAAAVRAGEPSPVATAQPDTPPSEGERTIIDIIRITAYSGRRFFAIGGATAVVVLLALFVVDVFVTHTTKPARDIYFKLSPPSAMVYTIPSGAEVTVDGKKQERVGRGEAVRLAVGPGTHEVAAYLSGFGWERTQIAVLPEKGRVQAETLRFKVPVYVRTKPEGATVIWDGREFGKTPLDGLPVAVTEQPVPIKFALPGVDTLACVLDLTRGGGYNVDPYIAVKSRPVADGVTALELDATFYARWRFIVSPASARFELDGEETSLGPDGNAVLFVKYGDHTARAKKESFSPCPIAFTVTSGETLTKRLTLLRQVTVVAIEADSRSEVSGATVTIDGTTHSSRNSFGLSIGSHTAVVKAEGYVEQTKTIRVGEAGESEIRVELPRGERPITICVLRNGVPVSGVDVQAVPEPSSGGSRKSLGETNAAGECRTSTGELLGRYKFDIIMADGGRTSDTTWHDISWQGKSTIAVNIPE